MVRSSFLIDVVGKNGKDIHIYKFRSMVSDADEILHQKDKKLLEEFKNGDWKLKNDPRITKLGRILRSLTIDEFPQLFNVLKGEMSMVGPRAYVAKELRNSKNSIQNKTLISDILSVNQALRDHGNLRAYAVPFNVSGQNGCRLCEAT